MRLLLSACEKLRTQIGSGLRGYGLPAALALAIAAQLAGAAWLSASARALMRPGGFAASDGRLPDLSGAQLVLFFSPTCAACTQVRRLLSQQLASTPDLRVVEVDDTLPGASALRESFDRRRHLPPDRLGVVPALFTPHHCYAGLEEIQDQLPATVARLLAPPAARAVSRLSAVPPGGRP